MGLFGLFGGKGKKAAAKNGQTSVPDDEEEKKGGYIAFVLLSSEEWDKQKLIDDLKADWNIVLEDTNDEKDNEKYKDVLVSEADGFMLGVSFMPFPVPDGEAEYYAKANYMWKTAEEVTKSHKAQILISIMGGEQADMKKSGRLFVKAVDSCLKQENAIAVYSDGAVYEPQFYHQFAALMKEYEEAVPIFNLIWFGLYVNDEIAGIYTYGMKKFGKDEIEVYVARDQADLNAIRNFVSDIVGYVIDEDVVLRDGETIGFTAEQKLPIRKSKGIAVAGDSLKIAYEG